MSLEKDNYQSANKVEIKNENYEIDVYRATRYTRIFLEILGVWPMVTRRSEKWQIYVSTFLIIACLLLMAFTMIPCTLHTLFREKDFLTRLMFFAPIGFYMTNIFKHCLIIFHRESIKRCIEHVEMDWMLIDSDNDRDIMTKNLKVGQNLTAGFGIFMYTGGLSYHTIMPILRGEIIDNLNRTIRPLVYPGYEIFLDPQKTPNYEIIFCTNCISACVTYTVTTAACNLAAIFVTHICGQIEIMTSRLENLFESLDAEARNETLKNRVDFIVKCHIRVLRNEVKIVVFYFFGCILNRLSSIIETVLREICLVEVVASTLFICLVEYYCMMVWNDSDTVGIITYLVLLISLSYNIFIFCHIGELLKEKCLQVGNATYMTDWYRLPGKSGLALVMIIAMANYPPKLTAGGMMELSICSFGAILKTTVVYLNMLQTMAV